KLVLSNSVTSPYIDNPFESTLEETGISNSVFENDYQIEYLKVWQKKNHVSDGYFSDASAFTKASKFFANCTMGINTSRFGPGTQYHWSIPNSITANPNNNNLQFLVPSGFASQPVDEWHENWFLSASQAGIYGVNLKIDNIPLLNLKPKTKLLTVIIVEDPVISCESILSNCTICEPDFASLSVTPDEPEMDFQWMHENTPIAGATESSYTTDESGPYKCVVTLGGCDRTTNVISVHISTSDPCGLKQSNLSVLSNLQIFVYPNPASDFLILNLSDTVKAVSVLVELTSLLGIVEESWNFQSHDQNSYSLPLTKFKYSGLYFLRIICDNKILVIPIQIIS
ncbi:MAG: T9SS type A sorting domain-containing protein, partial [Chitinophagales bacterium]